ncbi:uncharacterized protein N7515_005680 [Penicillium bovifimosum]|uniref:Uncharacterized protein n=1 Tax=Penicillium bovifimosum TaxID=126998 RepID=A0A9W9GUJ7_9EURO|nr:uncharacterized protein N7515_005680 [Penicillium bovifimosum]KAJ5129641.1 hypothetical protein N7515_005680 [Penicillium bovifimosum]
MSQTVSQFIFFRVKPSVRPEEASSDEGLALTRAFNITKSQSGHKDSAWGRVCEDTDTIAWVVEWNDARSTADLRLLDPLLATENPRPVTSLYVTLSPPISDTETLTKNRVTELCTLLFPGDYDVADLRELNADLNNFRTALVEQLPPSAGPRSWSMGHVDRPSKVPHERSPDGQAFMHFLAVGWDSIHAHMKAKETDEFKKSIAPLREKMLGPIPGLELKHVSFQKI